MKKYILVVMVTAAISIFGMTVQQRVELAVQDINKIAELMPDKPDERDQFIAELLQALNKMPASPKERCQKIVAAKKAFADIQEKERNKLLVFPSAVPQTFTGVQALDATSCQTNSVSTNIIWVLDEIDMGYGLDRRPRTQDKTKKYYPGWKRGEEPCGYPYQTIQ